jgi:hypothetical protein
VEVKFCFLDNFPEYIVGTIATSWQSSPVPCVCQLIFFIQMARKISVEGTFPMLIHRNWASALSHPLPIACFSTIPSCTYDMFCGRWDERYSLLSEPNCLSFIFSELSLRHGSDNLHLPPLLSCSFSQRILSLKANQLLTSCSSEHFSILVSSILLR